MFRKGGRKGGIEEGRGGEWSVKHMSSGPQPTTKTKLAIFPVSALDSFLPPPSLSSLSLPLLSKPFGS